MRVLCSSGNYERAAEIVEESGSKAAAYQLASRLKMEKEVCCVVVDVHVWYHVCIVFVY